MRTRATRQAVEKSVPQSTSFGDRMTPHFGGGRSRPSHHAARRTQDGLNKLANHRRMSRIDEYGCGTPKPKPMPHPPPCERFPHVTLCMTPALPCGIKKHRISPSLSQPHPGLQTGRPAMSRSRQSRPLPLAWLPGCLGNMAEPQGILNAHVEKLTKAYNELARLLDEG